MWGRAEWNAWNERGSRNGIEYFQRAVESDPGYAPAWAGLSDAYDALGQFNVLPPKVAWLKARATAERAIQLDGTLSEAHASLAGVLTHEWSWSAGEQEVRRAIALNPNNALAHQRYGYLLSFRGQFEAAIGEMRRALELDPFGANKQNSLASTLARAGRFDEALQAYHDVPDPDFNSELRHRRIATLYEQKGMTSGAMAEWLMALRLGGKEEVAASVDSVYRRSGYTVARRVYLWGDLRQAERRAQNEYPRPPAFGIAADYALLGEQDKAFAWLERSFREREGLLMFLTVSPYLAALRSDDRFRGLARRMGLPDTTVQDSALLGTH